MESVCPSTSRPTLHLLCGKIAAGKSTLAHQLAQQTGALISSYFVAPHSDEGFNIVTHG